MVSPYLVVIGANEGKKTSHLPPDGKFFGTFFLSRPDFTGKNRSAGY
jgi:hypothetical protein